MIFLFKMGLFLRLKKQLRLDLQNKDNFNHFNLIFKCENILKKGSKFLLINFTYMSKVIGPII